MFWHKNKISRKTYDFRTDCNFKKKEENNVMMLFIYTHPVNSNFKIWQQYQISSFNGIYGSLKFYTPFFPSGYILLSILKNSLFSKTERVGMWLRAILPISCVQQAELCISKTKTWHTKPMIWYDSFRWWDEIFSV